MNNRDWRIFWIEAFKRIKHVLIATALVPIYFLLMSPKISEPGYWSDLACSTRVGFQMGLFYWFMSTGIYVLLYHRDPTEVVNKRRSIKFHMLTGFPIMLIGLWLTALTEPYISGEKWDLQSYTVGMLVGSITFLVSVLYFAYKSAQEHNLKLRAESAESSLNVLKNQMQPHFLFNSLNSLAELIDADNGQAAKMAQKLSDLYRQILENSKSPLSSLASEIEIIKRYLELEKLRFGDRLNYQIIAPDNSDAIMVPSLTLQTLVENAIKHGISQSISGGNIAVKVENKNHGYLVNIENTGSMAKSEFKTSGTGIENTKSRLDLLYGDHHQFNLKNLGDKTVASFWFKGAPLAN